MNIKKMTCYLVSSIIIVSTITSKAADYAKSYAVVVKKSTYADPQWKAVVSALVKKHDAKVVYYDQKESEALPALRETFPKYVCFVVKPSDAGFKHTVATSRMMRKLDEDPFTDAIFSTITGYTPKDALRMALATKPTVASNALITAGVGAKRYKEAYYISTGTRGEYGHVLPDDSVDKRSTTGETTSLYVDFFNKLDPDIVISSAHASQRNLEMPFSKGNIICKNGKLYGALRSSSLIDYNTGQAKKGVKVTGNLLPLNPPKNPKVYFAVGNCLIGDIPDRNCMALAWMGFGKANQMIGYTVTTWYGKMGWGIVKIWEPSGGYAPLNECYFFSNQQMKNFLVEQVPSHANVDIELGSNTHKVMNVVINKLQNDAKIGKLKIKAKNQRDGQAKFRDAVGILHDIDTVAIYGDPAFEVYLDKKHTFKASRLVKLVKNGNNYKLIIHANVKHGTPQSWYGASIGEFLPERVKNVKLISGKEFKPVITDNFIMVTKPGPFEAGKNYTIEFTADPIK